MNLRRCSRHSASITVFALAAGGVLGPAAAGLGSAPPSAPDGADSTTATTVAPLLYALGTFASPDGSFTADFADAPNEVLDAASGTEHYVVSVDEDSESVVVFPPAALGATASSSAAERADLFLEASGTDIARLANTPTSFGPFPASHFVAQLTLSEGRRATVYGVVVDRGSDVVYAFYTDIGDDDNGAATAFVQSFTIVMEQPPTPAEATTTSMAPDTTNGAPTPEATDTTPTDTTATDMTTTDTTTTDTTTTAPHPTVASAPNDALLGFDGRWWITYPDGVLPAFRASTEDGFAYAEYFSAHGEDILTVRITEVPAGYEWDADRVPAAAAERLGGAVTDFKFMEVNDRTAVWFTLAEHDGAAPGDTVQTLVVHDGDRIYTVSFEDRGVTSSAAAYEFIASFDLA